MTCMAKMMRLKNGTEEVEGLVHAILVGLNQVAATDPILFYELVMLCRSPTHDLWGGALTVKKLEGMSFMEPGTGRVPASVKNVVLSAVTGDGVEMKLDNPSEGGPR